eukprot:1153391-Pelagomonas_calceolata.AAC.7
MTGSLPLCPCLQVHVPLPGLLLGTHSAAMSCYFIGVGYSMQTSIMRVRCRQTSVGIVQSWQFVLLWVMPLHLHQHPAGPDGARDWSSCVCACGVPTLEALQGQHDTAAAVSAAAAAATPAATPAAAAAAANSCPTARGALFSPAAALRCWQAFPD